MYGKIASHTHAKQTNDVDITILFIKLQEFSLLRTHFLRHPKSAPRLSRSERSMSTTNTTALNPGSIVPPTLDADVHGQYFPRSPNTLHVPTDLSITHYTQSLRHHYSLTHARTHLHSVVQSFGFILSANILYNNTLHSIYTVKRPCIPKSKHDANLFKIPE